MGGWQWRSQKFAKGDKTGGLGDGSPPPPPAGSRGTAPVGVWGEAPRNWRHTDDGGHAPMSPLATPLAVGVQSP